MWRVFFCCVFLKPPLSGNVHQGTLRLHQNSYDGERPASEPEMKTRVRMENWTVKSWPLRSATISSEHWFIALYIHHCQTDKFEVMTKRPKYILPVHISFSILACMVDWNFAISCRHIYIFFSCWQLAYVIWIQKSRQNTTPRQEDGTQCKCPVAPSRQFCRPWRRVCVCTSVWNSALLRL